MLARRINPWTSAHLAGEGVDQRRQHPNLFVGHTGVQAHVDRAFVEDLRAGQRARDPVRHSLHRGLVGQVARQERTGLHTRLFEVRPEPRRGPGGVGVEYDREGELAGAAGDLQG